MTNKVTLHSTSSLNPQLVESNRWHFHRDESWHWPLLLNRKQLFKNIKEKLSKLRNRKETQPFSKRRKSPGLAIFVTFSCKASFIISCSFSSTVIFFLRTASAQHTTSLSLLATARNYPANCTASLPPETLMK